ncbi:class I adenylate-forming enzyme family protein [Streptomyces sp. NPDC005151]
MTLKKNPTGLGLLFAEQAQAGRSTIFQFSRPFDIVPEAGTEFSVPALAGLVEEMSAALYAAGARAGDRVAIAKDNHWDYLVLACATARFGGLPVLIAGGLPALTLGTVLKRAEAQVLVTTEGILRGAAEHGLDLKSLVPRTVTVGVGAPGTVTLEELRGARMPRVHRTAGYEPMVATHTSGTTGVPKLVVHSVDTVLGHLGRTESLRFPIVAMKRSDTVATATPYNHMRMITWSTGTLKLEPKNALVLTDADPATAERMFAQRPPTYLEALPATYIGWQELAERRPELFADVRLFVSTFDAMHPPTVRRFLNTSKRRFPSWLQGWGQSETGPMTFRLLTRRALASTGDRHPTTRDLGRPIPGFTAVKVVDPVTMKPVPNGRPGVLFTRTDGRCIGYLGEQQRWQEKARGKWWNTGDYGMRTASGGFRLLDREVDVIPRMSCIELEDVLADRLPQLVEAAVIGIPGKLPLPVLSTPDGTLDMDAWRRATADLPPLGEPHLLPLDEIPRTTTGKVRRGELRERLLGEETFGTGRWT